MNNKMNIILFGPQGSGKGTQAELIEKTFKLYHLSMGDELRKEIKAQTALGKKIKKIVDSGALVPHDITNSIALNISKDKKAKNGIIFDGYPRAPEQWAFTKKNFKIDAAIELSLSEKESVKRIASRRICPKCGRNYNTIYLKPKKEGYCDDDNTKLVQRDDDKPKAIKDRLKTYHSQTEPLKKEYSELGILYVVNGEQPIEKVSKDLLKILKH
jgi:adenylate kinase